MPSDSLKESHAVSSVPYNILLGPKDLPFRFQGAEHVCQCQEADLSVTDAMPDIVMLQCVTTQFTPCRWIAT